MNIIDLIIEALRRINNPRYYRNERGFITEFYHQLSPLVQNSRLYPPETILETEVQKRRADHFGINQRPDMLIHIPIETGLTDRPDENNFVVFAAKRRGGRRQSLDDFRKLDEMFLHLNYELGIYINLQRYPSRFLPHYVGPYKPRIHEFSIALNEENDVNICHSYFINETPMLDLI